MHFELSLLIIKISILSTTTRCDSVVLTTTTPSKDQKVEIKQKKLLKH